MEVNFESKLKEIDKLLSCWFHRTLTVYGKITVIKTLALSKLSHLALVLPNLNKNQLNAIEASFFRFLWGNKPDKVSRDHTKLSEKNGGLGMVDIKNFWDCLKFSWFRRLCKSSAFWPNILVKNVSKVINDEVNITDMLQLGPNAIVNIGKKLGNNFWKQIFCSITPFMQGAIFCHPEMILNAPFWDNSMILRNNRAIKKSAFPAIAKKINTIADFYHPGSNILLSKFELENKYNLILNQNDFIELNHIIKLSL